MKKGDPYQSVRKRPLQDIQLNPMDLFYILNIMRFPTFLGHPRIKT
jgi:hypothetical protein